MVRNAVALAGFLLAAVVFSGFAYAGGVGDAEKRVRALVESKASSMDIGVAFIHVESGRSFFIERSKSYPLASVYKLPVMLRVLRMAEEGRLSLTDMVEIRNMDLCIGSGDMRFAPVGSRYSVSHCLHEMMSVSDNTAADLLWNRYASEGFGGFLSSIGAADTRVYIANRPSWLLSLGRYSGFRGMNGFEIASAWSSMSRTEQAVAIAKVLDENSRLTIAEFQRIEDESEEAGSYEADAVCAEALDNVGTPRDFARMLSDLYKGEILGGEMTGRALSYLASCKYNSRIPAGLPPKTRVWHKTGTICACVNDAGIIEFGEKSHGALAVFVRGVKKGGSREAAESIASISRIIYECFR